MAFKDANYYLQSSSQLNSKAKQPTKTNQMANQIVNYPLVAAPSIKSNYTILNNGNVVLNANNQQQNVSQLSRSQVRLNAVDFKR